MIEGVVFKNLVTYPDERGYFRELIRNSDAFVHEDIGQISHSLVYAGVVKAWHAHKEQAQWNYVISGLIYVALHDLRKHSSTYGETMTFLSGNDQNKIIYKFPPGVLHGYKCIDGPMNIIYVTSGIYDINDEIRIEHNDPEIGFDWINTFKIK
ncbi:MAG: dTDP-4-dehydrorhamnose 3,5-epimerase family protein [Chitinophagaceae bacterium]|nr:dTDP-4-dehydrorhamnose 3,5-epimerase family protein [Chitinophagaceae bacterium]